MARSPCNGIMFQTQGRPSSLFLWIPLYHSHRHHLMAPMVPKSCSVRLCSRCNIGQDTRSIPHAGATRQTIRAAPNQEVTHMFTEVSLPFPSLSFLLSFFYNDVELTPDPN
jgi:hypothetical protein